MSTHACAHPLGLDRLAAYLGGELAVEDDTSVEDHVFECLHCAARLDAIDRMGAQIRELARGGEIGVVVSDAVVRRFERDGVKLRQYRLAAGDVVPCTAAPEDDFLVVRLSIPPSGPGGVTLAVDAHTLATDRHDTFERHHLLPDVSSSELIMLFPGRVVRSYPRSVWTMQVRRPGDAEASPEPYVLDHTPWNERANDPGS